MKNENQDIPVNVLSFDKLVKETIKNAQQITEYFRLNLIYYQLISSKGLEFDRIKEYTPGSDPRRIDWKIFARTGKLMIRAFKEERRFDIVVILDVSNSMLLGTNEYTKNEYGALVAGILAFAATEAGDNIGGGLFSDDKQNLINPEGEYYNFLRIISDKENYGGKKNWAKLTNELITNYDDDAIVFIVSDFINANPDHFLPELSSNFAKVYGVMVRDPIDNKLPEGVGKIYLRDPHTHKVVLADLDVMREEYEVAARREIDKIKDMFHQYGELFFSMETGEEFATGFMKSIGGEKVIVL